jgi:hypothetical protein
MVLLAEKRLQKGGGIFILINSYDCAFLSATACTFAAVDPLPGGPPFARAYKQVNTKP